MSGSTQGKNLWALFGIIALIAIILIGLFGLVALGRDIEQILFAIGPTLVSLVGIVAVLFRADQVAKVNDNQNEAIDELHTKADQISTRVNGQLDAKFKNLNEKIAGLSNQVQLANNLNVPQTDITDDSSQETTGP